MRKHPPKPTAPGDEVCPPEEMVRSRAADWIRASEAAEHDFTSRCSTCLERSCVANCSFSLMWMAWRRSQATRETWLQEHGLADSATQWKLWPAGFPSGPKATDFTGEDGRFVAAVDALDQDNSYLQLIRK